MKNPFKQIGQPPKDAPKEVKKKVLNELATIKLVMDMTDLFSNKYVDTVGSFLKAEKNK